LLESEVELMHVCLTTLDVQGLIMGEIVNAG
jgi:hypothetical protein